MIARSWRGWTAREDAEAYVAYLEESGAPASEGTPGNRGFWILRREEGERCEFLTLSLWDSLEAVEAFAGKDVEQAVFFPEDDRFLLERERIARHYEVAYRS